MSGGNPAIIGRLQRKRLFVKTRRRSIHKGARRAGRPGTSLEFSDFRSYQPGDDIRLIDWNLYGRTGKHYIKRFLDEQEIHAAVFLDATGSMLAAGEKWRRAKEIAAALSFIALNGEDRLTFVPVTASTSGKVTRKGAVYAKGLFTDILALEGSGLAGAFTENILRENCKNMQAAFLISDGLESPGEFENLFRKLAASMIEVKFIQVLSQEEIEPSFSGDLRLIDSETGEAVNVTMRENVIEMYKSRLARHNHELESLCKRFGFTYLLVSDTQDLHHFLFHICTAKKVLE